MGRSYEHARRKMVNPPRLPEWALPAGERLEKARQAAIQRAAQEIGTPSSVGQDAGGDLREQGREGLPGPGRFDRGAARYRWRGSLVSGIIR